MPNRLHLLAPAALLLASTACAPRILAEAAVAPAGLAAIQTYRLAADDTPPAVRDAVVGTLAAVGLERRDQSPNLLTIRTTVRPRSVGAFVPGCAAEAVTQSIGGEDKLPLRSATVVSLGVTLSEEATGRLLYRSEASTRSGHADLARLAPRLAQAAVRAAPTPLTTPPACAD